MIFAGLDTETTGIDPKEHRFVEVYIGLYDLNGKKLDEFNQKIDPQRSISIEAQRVHGISSSDLIGMPIWDDVAPKVNAILSKVDFIVAHNGIDFDMPFINSEMTRVGQLIIEKKIVDTMIDSRWATPRGKIANLGELCFACGVDYDPTKAHRAHYDVDVMVECFLKGQKWGYFKT